MTPAQNRLSNNELHITTHALDYLFWQQIGAEVLSVLLRNAEIFREIAVDNELEQQREEQDQASPARQPRSTTEMTFGDVGDRGCAAAEKSARTDATALPTPRSGATVLDGGNFGGGAGETGENSRGAMGLGHTDTQIVVEAGSHLVTVARHNMTVSPINFRTERNGVKLEGGSGGRENSSGTMGVRRTEWFTTY